MLQEIGINLTVFNFKNLFFLEMFVKGFIMVCCFYCFIIDYLVTVTEYTKSNIEKDDDSYHFSVSKKFVKEGFKSVLKVLSDSLPEIIGGLGGVKIGTAVVKANKKTTSSTKSCFRCHYWWSRYDSFRIGWNYR